MTLITILIDNFNKLFITTGYIQNGISLQFVAAMVSSIITCFVSMPVDAAKTR